jgi:acyl carrier protein
MSRKNIDLHPIKEKVKNFIRESVHIEVEKIRDDSLIFKEGYLDSMGFIMMITFIEEEFAIKTNDEDLIEENFESINSITGYISRKLQQPICAE